MGTEAEHSTMQNKRANLAPAPDSLDPKEALYMAKIAEAAERYEDMTEYMKASAKDCRGNDLTVEQRNLISVGYKNLMAARRTAWRVIDNQCASEKDEAIKARSETYKSEIAKELKDLVDI